MTLFPHFLEEKCSKILRKLSKFEDCFFQLGAEWHLSESVFHELEEYVCNSFGHREKNIKKVRWLLFQKKHAKENKVIDLSTLPLCCNILRIRSEMENFVAKVWRSSLKSKLTKRVSQIMARMNMVTFGGLTKHFLTILEE